MRAAAFHFLYPVKMPYKALGKSVIVMCFRICFRMCSHFSFLFCYADQLCFDVEVIRIKPGHKYHPHCEHNSKKTIFIILGYPVYLFIRNQVYKLLSLNVRGRNSLRKRRQVFRWLHQSDIIFLQETYSLPESIKRWETEWVGKIVSSHSSSHSRGVMILFKPCLDVDFQKINADNSGRCILAETIIDGTKVVLVNIYAPNDATQQVVFLRDVSKEFLITYANDNLVLGGDFNCTISTLDKKGGRPISFSR